MAMAVMAACGELEKMGLYFNITPEDEFFLLHKQFLFSGTGTSGGEMYYWPGNAEDWPLEPDIICSNFPNAETVVYVNYAPIDLPANANTQVGKLLEMDIGSSGATQYTGQWEDDFPERAQPPYIAFGWKNRGIPVFQANQREWHFTDGTQYIYFSETYSGNYDADESGFIVKHYVGYGSDDDGSVMYQSDFGHYFYDINFKVTTTGTVVVSEFPMKIVSFDSGLVGFRNWVTPGDIDFGDVYLIYPYNPFNQNFDAI